MIYNHVDCFSGVRGFSGPFSEQAGVRTVLYCEIDPHCRKVIRHHCPDVPIVEDIRELTAETVKPVGHIHLVTGGFPCQDLSVAGKRSGLGGERSGLWFEFHRVIMDIRPDWVIIENVPGLLSSGPFDSSGKRRKGIDFAIVLAGLTGLVPEIPDGGWKRGGFLGGLPGLYSVGWRSLDARFFGVPQRRERVFIVGHLGGFGPLEVLFESNGLSGDFAPRRRKRKAAAGLSEDGPDRPSWWDGSEEADTLDLSMLAKGQMMPERHRMPVVFDGRNSAVSNEETPTLQAKESGGHSLNALPMVLDNHAQDGRLKPFDDGVPTLPGKMGQGGNNQPLVLDDYNQTVADEVPSLRAGNDKLTNLPIVARQRGGYGWSVSEDEAPTLVAESGTHQGGPNEVPIIFQQNQRQEVRLVGDDGQTVGTLSREPGTTQQNFVAVPQAFEEKGNVADETPAIRENARGHTVVAFESKGDGSLVLEDESPTLRSMNYDKSHVNAGGQVAVALTTYETPKFAEDEALTLTSPSPSGGGQPPAVAIDWGNGQTSERTQIVRTEGGAQVSATRPDAVFHRKLLRRLTPRECERLQGFPDDYTAMCSDTQRYRQMGNAVNWKVAAVLAQRWKAVADKYQGETDHDE